MSTNLPEDPTNNSAGGNEGGNEGEGGTGAPTGGNQGNQSETPLSAEEAVIAFVVSSLIPKFQEQASSTPMETDESAPAGDGSDNQQNEPPKVPKEPQLTAKFVARQAQVDKAGEEEAAAKKRVERRVRGMAQRNTTVSHFEPYSRGVQSFLKHFLGGPEKPHDYPPPPSEEEKEAQYWIEKRTEFILKQLDVIRHSLCDKPPAEQDYFVSRAESEIRKSIKAPPFTPAPKKGETRGSRTISSQTKGSVERELAAAGISRMTFDWTAAPADSSAWNVAVVDVMGKKSVEWLRLSMKITDEEAIQAPAIILRWLNGKCREIREFGNVEVGAYDASKKAKLAKAQYARWRKKICENRCKMAAKVYPNNHQLAFILANKDSHSDIEDAEKVGDRPVRCVPVWRSDPLSTVVHGLDKMVMSQATHHKQRSVHKDIYGRSKSVFSKKSGIEGVPRNLPVDAYAKSWREGLCKFDQDTVSEVGPFSVMELAKGMDKLLTLAPQEGTAPNRGPTQQGSSAQAGPSGERSMNID
ncbi:uncharacterized protein PGTG_19338 [Puccinia graminis f. sp. tritici CRL 75-36-700-3]|uniref:Uncharacterized protein n=1 Tax=Puccinia graminis f. sp. tritici (strain CRL 75-36-700-3 / race SCCL) TaxID=418459 RepID=E3LAV2_PUCGT|nr:uncharacterized protein PGTG_19338 [Puccinia graminis f. sp. tritici CRL 75-36-700-3]EFP93677.2 hypothetical protein PGTG_19338 [Puccinia graminis f. sp. tritici CRL 75-36-700-3]